MIPGVVLCLGLLLLGLGCRPAAGPPAFPESAQGALTLRYPLDASLFPPDLAAPAFAWQDETPGVQVWSILFRFAGQSDPLRFPSTEDRWRPSESDWSEIKRRSTEEDAEVAILGLGKNGEALSATRIRIRTSTDPVEDAIFYREVPLPFIEAVQDPARIRWRFGAVDSPTQPPIVLEDLPVCGNCHSFSGDGSVLGLDVDYGNDKGGYAVLPVEEEMVLDDEKIITWSDYRRDDDEATFGLLSQVSPDGRYVVSTVKDRAVFVATPEIAFSQLFFPIKGILVVYDRETGEYTALPGADDPDYVQSNPTWSPDGESIVFARAKAYRKDAIENSPSILLSEHDVPEFVEDNEPFKFDLYRVPFNGGRGGEAVPIEGASHNGRSNYFAKFSPDGKWIVFCQAENYMLLMPDSELFILPAEGGTPRKLRANTPLMNSWHSFNSTGRWLVFSSKAYTPYTQLFLTHLDERGHSTPPVVLDRFTSPDRAANIPEFVPIDAKAIAKIDERFLDAYSFLRAGMANERTGNYPGAIESYEQGLAVEPDNVELLNALGFSLFQQGRSEDAAEALEKAVELDPGHAKAHNNLALTSIDLEEFELAEAHYRESLEIEPHPAIFNDLGFVLERQGMTEEAIEAYRGALALDPASSTANYNLASHLARAGEFAEAATHFRAAAESEPNTRAETGLGVVLAQLGRADEAIARFEAAIALDPSNAAAYDHLGTVHAERGDFEAAAEIYRRLTRQTPSPAAHLELAQALSKLGRTEEAEAERRKAAEMPSATR